MSYSLGVDLGTTFVAAAVARGSRVKMVTLGDWTVVTPAVVYARDDGSLVTGEAANRRAVSSPERVGREFKRRLGDPTPVMLGGTPHAVTALLAALLKDTVAKVTETEGGPPANVVLTHPANWGPYRRELFEEVPQLADVPQARMITEPEAAAAHYAAARHLADGDTVAVYDLGGGTFDATVLRKRAGINTAGIDIVGSPEGIERLGGVDFDDAILAHINFSSGGALSELDLSNPQTGIALARLRQDCIAAKEALSVDTEAAIPVFLPNRHFDIRLTRGEFEDMIRAQIESTIGALTRTLRSARVEPADLNAVLLVGGSSQIPLVAQMITAALNRPTLVDAHPKYAVALGAATLAAELAAPSTHGEAPLRPAAPAEFVGPPVSAAASRASWVGGDTPRSTPATDPFAGAGKSAHPDAAAPTAPPIAEPSPEQPYASELLPQAPSVDLSESWTPDAGHAVGRPPAAAPRGDDVQFTVYRPAQIAPLEWCPLLVYAHQSAPFLEPETGRMIDPEREVVTDAGRELPQGRPYRRSITDSADSIPPLGELLLQPWLSEGFVDPPHQELEWHGSTQRADFQICAPANPTSARISGGVRFFLGPVILVRRSSASISLREEHSQKRT